MSNPDPVPSLKLGSAPIRKTARRTKMSDSWFSIDDDAFIRQQRSRPTSEIVRELLQNALDADGVKQITITTGKRGPHSTITVEDDGAGFANDEMLWKVFLSGKADQPNKRGRKGRGVKEAIASALCAEVEILGRTLFFESGSGRTRKWAKNGRTRGTRVTLELRRSEGLAAALASVRMIQPPSGVALLIDGTFVVPRGQLGVVNATLPTVIIRGDDESEQFRDCTVFRLQCGCLETAHLFEMGVPVCEIKTPWHLDVQQRIPMPDHRNVVTPAYTARLMTAALNAVADSLDATGFAAPWAIDVLPLASASAKQKFMKETFGERIAVRNPFDENANALVSEQLNYKVIDTAHLPSAVAQVVRFSALSTTMIYQEALDEEAKRPIHYAPLEQTEDENRTCRFGVWLAHAVTGRVIECLIDFTTRSDVGHRCYAVWNESNNRITLSRSALGPAAFKDPTSPLMLSTLIHEISHIGTEDPGHGKVFLERLGVVAGIVASTVCRDLDRIIPQGSSLTARPYLSETETEKPSTKRMG